MKTTKSITIDSDLWLEAQNRTNNISATISELLSEWVKTAKEKPDLKDLEKTRAELESEKKKAAALSKKIKEYENKLGKVDDNVVKILTRE